MPTKKRYEHKITLGKDIDGNLIRKSFYSTKSVNANIKVSHLAVKRS